MICKKCKKTFKNANSWSLCCNCFLEYERQIPEYIPKEQHPKYLLRTIIGDT